MFEKAIKDNYDIRIKSTKLLADHGDKKVYLLASDYRKYVLKTIPSRKNKERLENDGKSRFYMQEFIDGTVLMVNTAPGWYLQKSAHLLGQMQSVLCRYKELLHRFDEGFTGALFLLKDKP